MTKQIRVRLYSNPKTNELALVTSDGEHQIEVILPVGPAREFATALVATVEDLEAEEARRAETRRKAGLN